MLTEHHRPQPVTPDYDIEDEGSFRAQLASVHADGRRKWVYARKPEGKLYRWRTITAWLLIVFFVTAPFVHLGSQQFMLLNLLHRRFVLFGIPFWPQDMWLLVLVFLFCLVSVVLATATIGRVWCGWMCPQTVFMEFIFRPIEWILEGSPAQQLKRKARWTTSRAARASVKHGIYFMLSFGIANVFLAYLISSDVLVRYISEGPAGHLDIIIPLTLFSVVFYLVFARFREQVCTIVCPYGRYMSSLVDDRTVTVTYDASRGEPRKKGKERSMAGACVDCSLCVSVCPTGIDIRNGIQLECVQCTACIDVCNTVMEKTGQRTGLIRYTSAEAVRTGVHRWLTPRIAAYAAVWLMLAAGTVFAFAIREPLDVVVLRQTGTTWVRTAQGSMNLFSIEIQNRSSESGLLRLYSSSKNVNITVLRVADTLKAYGHTSGTIVLTRPTDGVETSTTLCVELNGKLVHSESLHILAPEGSVR